jgi:hypothetical protein
LHVPVGEDPTEELVDVVGGIGVVVVVDFVTGGEVVVVVVGAVVGDTLVVVVAVVVAVVGDAGAVPREGFGRQVETCKPAVRDTRPSGPRGSEKPAGRLPT